MASLIDEMYYRQGWIDHGARGVTAARAGDSEWQREAGETEPAFIGRVCREAAASGFRVASIFGQLQVDEPPVRIADVRFDLPPEGGAP